MPKEVKKHFPLNSIMVLCKFDSRKEMLQCLNDETFQSEIGKITNIVLRMNGRTEILSNPKNLN